MTESKATTVIRAESMIVQPRTWPTLARTQGSLVADEVTSVGAKVPGRIAAIHADLGDRVQAGAKLLQLDDSQYKLLVLQAEAQLTQARSAVGLREGDPLAELNPENAAPVREARAVWDEAKKSIERLRVLAEQNAVSQTDLEVADAAERVASARYTSAQNSVREKIALIGVSSAQLELAKQNLVDTTVLAPFAGVIQNRAVAVGTYVQLGQSLMTVVRTDPLRFRGAVPERFAQQLRIGQEVDLQLELSGQRREVEITRISPTLDQLNRSLSFEAIVDNRNQQLRSGLFAEAEIVLDPEATAIVIPNTALIRFAGVDKVWKITGDSVREQAVRIGRQEGESSEIVFGLSVGDSILVHGELGKVGRFEAIDSTRPDET